MWLSDLSEAVEVYVFRNREMDYVHKFDSARDSWRSILGAGDFTSIAFRAIRR